MGNSEVAGLRRPWWFLPISRSLLPKEIELHSCANMLLVRTCGAKVKLPRIILYPSPSCGSDRAWVNLTIGQASRYRSRRCIDHTNSGICTFLVLE